MSRNQDWRRSLTHGRSRDRNQCQPDGLLGPWCRQEWLTDGNEQILELEQRLDQELGVKPGCKETLELVQALVLELEPGRLDASYGKPVGSGHQQPQGSSPGRRGVFLERMNAKGS